MSSHRPAALLRATAVGSVSLALLFSLAFGAIAPTATSASISGGSAFNELTEGGSATSTSTTPTTATTGVAGTEPTSNSRSVILLAGIAAVVLLLGIGFVIVRDARRIAPAGDVEMAEASSAHDAAIRVRKRRAKTKAARQQRKRNRSR